MCLKYRVICQVNDTKKNPLSVSRWCFYFELFWLSSSMVHMVNISVWIGNRGRHPTWAVCQMSPGWSQPLMHVQSKETQEGWFWWPVCAPVTQRPFGSSELSAVLSLEMCSREQKWRFNCPSWDSDGFGGLVPKQPGRGWNCEGCGKMKQIPPSVWTK